MAILTLLWELSYSDHFISYTVLPSLVVLLFLLFLSVLREEMEQGGLLGEGPEEEGSGGDGHHGATGRGQHQPGRLGEDDGGDGVHEDGGLGHAEAQQADRQTEGE